MTKKLEAGPADKNLKPARLKARTEPHLGVLGQARADLKKKSKTASCCLYKGNQLLFKGEKK